MAFADTLRSGTPPTFDDVADLIEGIAGSSTYDIGWTNHTPTYGVEAGTYTSVTTYYSKYIRIGKLCIWCFYFGGTTSALTEYITATMPFNFEATLGLINPCAIYNGSIYVSGRVGYSGTNTARFYRYDSTDITAGSNRQVYGGILYEID